MSQANLPLDEQTAGMPPETKATHRRSMNRQRQKMARGRWWFEQMRRAVDKAPEPKPKEQQ